MVTIMVNTMSIQITIPKNNLGKRKIVGPSISMKSKPMSHIPNSISKPKSIDIDLL